MKTFSNKQGIIKIEGETYYHFSHGGKQTSTKFIKVDDETYYNSNKPYEFESQSSNQIFMIEEIGWLIVAVSRKGNRQKDMARRLGGLDKRWKMKFDSYYAMTASKRNGTTIEVEMQKRGYQKEWYIGSGAWHWIKSGDGR